MNDSFALLYEGFGLSYIEHFSDDLYETGVYTSLGWSMLLTTTILMLIYYFLLSNFGKLYTKLAWLMYIAINAVINFFIADFLTNVAIEDYYATSDQGHTYIFTEFFQISLLNAIYAFILSFILSLIFKSFSVHARKTPF